MNDKVIATGFGYEGVDGVYYYDSEYNGYPLYKKDNFKLFFSCLTLAHITINNYFIFEIKDVDGVVALEAKYKINGFSPIGTSTDWVSMCESATGETAFEV